MKNDSYENVFFKIVALIEQRQHVDYGSRKSVRAYNRAYEKCRKLIEWIDLNSPTDISNFCSKVFASDWQVQSLCAPMILQMKNATDAQKREAAQCIIALLDNPSVDSITKRGFSMNLHAHKYDQWLEDDSL